MEATTNKATAVRRVLPLLEKRMRQAEWSEEEKRFVSLSAENVVSFGDGNNDAEFLAFAGLGIAMANGRDLAKRSATFVSDYTNDESAVAKELAILARAGRFGEGVRRAWERSGNEF